MSRDGRRAVLVALLAGVCLVLGSRALLPFAPALYDGIAPVSPEPYRYASPPPDLSAGNKPPLPVESTLQFVNGTNLAHAVVTPDQQLLVSFNDGSIHVSGQSSLHVHIGAVTQPPAAPANSTYIGNVYEVIVTDYKSGASASAGFAIPPQPAISGNVQALMRVPPVSYNNIRLYYDGAWHDTGNNWGAQGDFVAISPLTHLGLVAAFNDAKKAPVKPSSGFPVVLVEVVIALAAIGIIGLGVLVQLRRRPPATTAPRHR